MRISRQLQSLALPPLGEGARRADEGLITSLDLEIWAARSPSSGLSATFPQKGKGELRGRQ